MRIHRECLEGEDTVLSPPSALGDNMGQIHQVDSNAVCKTGSESTVSSRSVLRTTPKNIAKQSKRITDDFEKFS